MKKKNPVKGGSAELSNPRENMAGFSVPNVMRELESSVTDAGGYLSRMERNENVRQCLWAGKTGTGRKKSQKNKPAKPWENASDHEVHLAQEVLLQLTAQRTAAMQRGSFSVTPMEGTDARSAGQLKQVLRYYLQTAMRSERLVQGTRWASWALRYGHAVLYIGWKTVKAMEKRKFRRSEVVDYVTSAMVAQMGVEGAPIDPVQGGELTAVIEDKVTTATANEMAAWLLQMYPELRQRGKEAEPEALRAAALLQKAEGGDPESYFYTTFIKEDRPYWEALRSGVDFFCPAETLHEDSFDNARWLARVRWVSAQQIREEGAMRGWDQAWMEKVIKDCKGKSRMFTSRTSKTPWALSGVGVGWGAKTLDAETHLYQIIEYYDRRVTADGAQCLYKTVLHPDVPDMVAIRELVDDWHGHYPFVPATNEQDEPLLLANRGVPELCASPQNGIKTQWDSRDDAASLSTMPPWTGPDTLQGTEIYPGAFIPEWRTGTVKPWEMPRPDGRSIEIEETLRKSVNRYFGLMSKDVPEPLSMLLGQTGTDWFLAAYSRAIALTAQVVQQRMPPLKGARITGTEIVFSASPEEVRGQFDFSVAFDVRALDIGWMKEILGFVKDVVLPFDNRGETNRRVLLEMGFNMIDPSLADRALPDKGEASQREVKEEEDALNMIFSGGLPQFVVGVDHQARADLMTQDLQRSPVRQDIMAANAMIAAVWQDRLQKHLFQLEQETNKVAGIEGGSDPLRQSPLAKLKAGGWQAFMAA